MPSTLAHIASASLIAVAAARVRPDERSYILAALIAAGALDVDHLVYVVRDRAMYRRLGLSGHLHEARSVFHELAGLLAAGIVSGLVFLTDPKLARVMFIAFAVHVAQDWVLGKSRPLAPVDSTEMRFFSPTLQHKIMLDIFLLSLFGTLWILFLFGSR